MRRHSVAFVGGAATMLAAFPLSAIFVSFTWMVYAALAIVSVVGAATLTRVVRGPVWAQVLASSTALLLLLTWTFPSGHEFSGIVPTPSTLAHLGDLLTLAMRQIRDQTPPVPDLTGLLMLTTAGVGAVMILVDMFAAGLRRPALAGLPMLAVYSVPVAVLPDGLALVPFAFAAAGFLWLLVSDSVDRVRRFGRRFTGDGRDIDVWEPSPLASAGRRLGVVGVAVAMLVPLAVPGMTSGLIDYFGTNDGIGSGPGSGRTTGAAVDLFALLSGDLVRDHSFEMVRFTTTDPNPFYLRFGIADQVTDKGFINRTPTGGAAVNRGLPAFTPPSAAGVVGRKYHADVRVVNFDMTLMPAFRQLTAASGLDNSWFFDPSSDQIFSRRSSAVGKHYEFDFVRMSYTPDALRAAGEISTTDANLAFVTVPVIPTVSDLVNNMLVGKNNEYDKVRAIYDHFGPDNGFRYTVHAPAGDSGNPIVDFLTTREGFCVQYSAAMAWLVRVAGYPARVAFGFTRGANASGGTYSLTNYNLHAWTEVYFPTYGWVPFDPTPASSVVGSVPTLWAPDPSNPSTGSGEPVDVPGRPTPGPTHSAAPDPGASQKSNTNAALSPIHINPWLLGGAFVAALLIAALLAPLLRRRTLRRRRKVRNDLLITIGADPAGPGPRGDVFATVGLDPAAIHAARQDAHASWAELLDTMIDYSIPVDDAESPRATAARLTDLPNLGPTIHPAASLLAQAEEQARYARAPIRPDGLNDAVRDARGALRAQATRRQRVSAVLLPLSVLRRWREAWFGWSSRSLATTGRWREASAALNPLRLLTSRTPH